MPFERVGVGSKVVQQLVGGRSDERSCHQDQHLHTVTFVTSCSLMCIVISSCNFLIAANFKLL